MDVVNSAEYLGFVVALVATPFFLVNGVKFMRQTSATAGAGRLQRMPIVSFLFMVIPLVSALVYESTIKESDRENIVTLLHSLPANSPVLVNGISAKNPTELLRAMKSVRKRPVVAS